MTLELIHRPARDALSAPKRPPLLFVHGSFSGAWVWEPHFLDYFAAHGWDCWAVSLRGHGASPGHRHLDSYGLMDYVADVAAAVATIGAVPVLIGHSMGGLVAQLYGRDAKLAGLALLASTPPFGMGRAMFHMGAQVPALLWQLGMLLNDKGGPDLLVLNRGLFSPDFPIEELRGFVPHFQSESKRVALEVMSPQMLWPGGGISTPTLVLGGDADSFIPVADLHATANYHLAELMVLPGLPHALMLDHSWDRAAAGLRGWLERHWG